MTVGVLFDESFLRHDLPGHPECAARARAIVDHFRASGLWSELAILPVRAAEEGEVAAAHDPSHLARLMAAASRGGGMIDPDTYLMGASMEAALKAAGAAIEAVDAILDGRVSSAFGIVRPPGHHATLARAMGFCLLNNAAIAARRAQARSASKVLIVDWDVHHGNGTQDIFWRDPTVFYFSMHRWPFYPGTGAESETGEGPGEGFTRNIPLPGHTRPDRYLSLFESAVAEIARAFRPDFTIVSSGFDAYARDPIGGLNLLPEHFGRMTEVLRAATNGRILSLLEGGYDVTALGRLAEAHVAQLKS